MKGSTLRLAAVLVGLGAIAALAAWKFWPGPKNNSNGNGQPGGQASRPSDKEVIDKAAALKAYDAGRTLYDNDEAIEARSKLSEAFFSGHLTREQENKILPVMTDLADKTLLSGNFYDGDPYVFREMIEPGDTLGGLARKRDLHVSWRLLAKINNIQTGGVIRAGAGITLVQGPFHAVVRKSRFTMDLYLQRGKLPKIFIKRFDVGIGAKATPTPPGRWHVAKDGKQEKASWSPPGSSPLTSAPIEWGKPGYPLGKHGYWIRLVGDDPDNRKYTGIGIHGTNDPTSVGKAYSLGCIRLREEDIEQVFIMLYEKWSTVTVLP